MNKATIDQLGWLERGNGKTQSNVVYSVGGGVAPCVCAGCGVKYWIYVVQRTNSNEETDYHGNPQKHGEYQ